MPKKFVRSKKLVTKKVVDGKELNQTTYNEGSLRKYILNNFWTMNSKQMAKKLGLSYHTIRLVIYQMQKNGALPIRKEVSREYFKKLKPNERTADSIAISLNVNRKTARIRAKIEGKELIPTSGYPTRKLYYLATYGIKTQTQMAKELGMDIAQVSRELKRFRKEQAIPASRQKELNKRWLSVKKKGAKVFEKGRIKQVWYPENSVMGIIQRNFYTKTLEELVEMTGKKIGVIQAMIYRMRKEGSIPLVSEKFEK